MEILLFSIYDHLKTSMSLIIVTFEYFIPLL